jgi:hypothetical protein
MARLDAEGGGCDITVAATSREQEKLLLRPVPKYEKWLENTRNL